MTQIVRIKTDFLRNYKLKIHKNNFLCGLGYYLKNRNFEA